MARQLSLLSLLELSLDQARPYLECELCASYSAGGTLYRCPRQDSTRCLHSHWIPDNIRWSRVHCRRMLRDCPVPREERPCRGEFVRRAAGWDWKRPPESAVRECPHAQHEICVGGHVLARYSHLARAIGAVEGHLGKWVTLEEIAALRKAHEV